MLRERLSSRRIELHLIKMVISNEETKSRTLAVNIARLEQANVLARRMLKAQERSIHNLLQFKIIPQLPDTSQIMKVKAKKMKGSTQEVRVEKQIIAHLVEQVDNTIKGTSDQIISIQETVSEFRASIQNIEMEVYAQRLAHAESLLRVSSSKIHQSSIEGCINLLVSGMNHIKFTPIDIWIKIFHNCVEEDMEEYLNSPTSLSIPATVIHLSQVCRFWRQVCLAEKDLWRFVAIFPIAFWRPANIEMLKHICSFNKPRPYLVFDLSRYHPSGYPRKQIYGTTSIGGDVVSLVKNYTLRIIYNGQYTANSSVLPFCRPKSVELYLLSNPHSQAFEALLAPFTELTRLEVISRTQYSSSPLRLSETHPELSYLKLSLTTFQAVDLRGYLGPNLTELHITQMGRDVFLGLTPVLKLPRLHVLGVTPPNTDFTHSLDLPALKKLILYGVQDTNGTDFERISLSRLAESANFARIQVLELPGWKYLELDVFPLQVAVDMIAEIVQKLRPLSC